MRTPSSGKSPLLLYSASLAQAPTVPADVRIAGRRQDFNLPVWIDNEGDLRIALPKLDPQHSSDFDQVIVHLSDLLGAIGSAIYRKGNDASA